MNNQGVYEDILSAGNKAVVIPSSPEVEKASGLEKRQIKKVKKKSDSCVTSRANKKFRFARGELFRISILSTTRYTSKSSTACHRLCNAVIKKMYETSIINKKVYVFLVIPYFSFFNWLISNSIFSSSSSLAACPPNACITRLADEPANRVSIILFKKSFCVFSRLTAGL